MSVEPKIHTKGDCFGVLGVVLLAAVPAVAMLRNGVAAGGTAH
jgi:hypothetical protein